MCDVHCLVSLCTQTPHLPVHAAEVLYLIPLVVQGCLLPINFKPALFCARESVILRVCVLFPIPISKVLQTGQDFSHLRSFVDYVI